MILIVGGSCQGKAEYARRLAVKEMDGQTADGSADSWSQVLNRSYLLNFHGFIRQVMEAGLNPDAFTEQVCGKEPRIVTLDEVGCGIVPMEKKERDYREAVGRAGQILAAQADEVYRIICGIPVRIK